MNDDILAGLMKIAAEIVALQAIGQYAMDHDIISEDLESHMRILQKLQTDVIEAISTRIVELALRNSQ